MTCNNGFQIQSKFPWQYHSKTSERCDEQFEHYHHLATWPLLPASATAIHLPCNKNRCIPTVRTASYTYTNKNVNVLLSTRSTVTELDKKHYVICDTAKYHTETHLIFNCNIPKKENNTVHCYLAMLSSTNSTIFYNMRFHFQFMLWNNFTVLPPY